MFKKECLANYSNLIVFGCRTTKLQSQKQCHQSVFFLTKEEDQSKKKRRLPSQKKPSSGILHRSHRNRLLWLCPKYTGEGKFFLQFSGELAWQLRHSCYLLTLISCHGFAKISIKQDQILTPPSLICEHPSGSLP